MYLFHVRPYLNSRPSSLQRVLASILSSQRPVYAGSLHWALCAMQTDALWVLLPLRAGSSLIGGQFLANAAVIFGKPGFTISISSASKNNYTTRSSTLPQWLPTATRPFIFRKPTEAPWTMRQRIPNPPRLQQSLIRLNHFSATKPRLWRLRKSTRSCVEKDTLACQKTTSRNGWTRSKALTPNHQRKWSFIGMGRCPNVDRAAATNRTTHPLHREAVAVECFCVEQFQLLKWFHSFKTCAVFITSRSYGPHRLYKPSPNI